MLQQTSILYQPCRGILVDTYRLESVSQRPNSSFQGNYTTEYRYAAAPWHNGFESTHRPLVEVHLSGTRRSSANAELVVRYSYGCSDFTLAVHHACWLDTQVRKRSQQCRRGGCVVVLVQL